MRRFFLSVFVTILFISLNVNAQGCKKLLLLDAEDAGVGASLTELYIPLLKDKNVGVVANQASTFNETHLVDTLLNSASMSSGFSRRNTDSADCPMKARQSLRASTPRPAFR